jgi:5'-nucleotidase
MHANPSQSLVIGISARALFDLQAQDQVLLEHGRDAHRTYQLEQADQLLPPGPGLPLVRALVAGGQPRERAPELIVLSDCAADLSLRVLSSARQQSLEVRRAAFTGGEPLAPYLRAFGADLFLSADAEEAVSVTDAGIATALVRAGPAEAPSAAIRIALDARAIALATEDPGAPVEVPRLPAPRWIRALAGLQRLGASGDRLVVTALVCCEEPPARERVLRALGQWGIELDQAFFTATAARDDLLAAFEPHVVFGVLPRARVEERSGERTREGGEPELESQRFRFRRRA